MALSRSFLSWKHWFQRFQQKQDAQAATSLCPNPTAQLKRGNHHAGWREIGGKRVYFRSKWECNYGRYLQYLKEQGQIQDWEHEPKTFWFDKIKRGVKSYLPDFRVISSSGCDYWVEVKGFLDSRSKTKLKRFKAYFPDEKLELVTGAWFKENNNMMRALIKDWE